MIPYCDLITVIIFVIVDCAHLDLTNWVLKFCIFLGTKMVGAKVGDFNKSSLQIGIQIRILDIAS